MFKFFGWALKLLTAASMMCFVVRAEKTIDEYSREASVYFGVSRQEEGGVLTLVGKENGEETFSLQVPGLSASDLSVPGLSDPDLSVLDLSGEYAQGNFSVMRLENELIWRYMSPDEMFYEVRVGAGGDIKLSDLPQNYTGFDQKKTFAFKTDGTIENRGNQAFHKLVLSANQFHNYGTMQMCTYHFFHNYSFNSGVLKSGEVPSGVADLRTEEMKKPVAKPHYKEYVIENYGKEISKGELEIRGGLSYHEYNESVFQDLQMTGGDIVINGGSANVAGRLTGAIKNMSVTCQGSFYINENAATRTGNWFAIGGALYTTNTNHEKIAQELKDLLDEEQLLKKLGKATKVTPEKAYENYKLILQGKEEQIYSKATLREIKRKYPNDWDWKAIVAMEEWGLSGGGGVESVVVGAALGYGADRLFNRHHRRRPRANVRATVGIDHRGNIAGGISHNSVAYQLRNQRRAQDRRANQVRETFENGPYMPLPRSKNHPYWKELEEVLPQKIKLARERKFLFKPVDSYNTWNHKRRINGTYKSLDNPLDIIRDAYNQKIDVTEYTANRDYFKRLYKALRDATVPHRDIAVLWNNPYVNTVHRWDGIPFIRQQMICKEYPEMPEIAREYGTWRKGQPQISEGVEDCTLDFALFAINIRTTTQLVKNVYTHAWKRFFDRKTVSTIIANKTALEEVAKWKNSEQYVSKMLGTKARPQVSYLNGKEVPYGTKGSVRPDFVIGNKAAFEVKNYDISKNSDGKTISVVAELRQDIDQ